MLKPHDYDTTKATTNPSAIGQLSVGGHICTIKQANVVETNYNGEKNTQLVLLFDITENSEYDGFFAKKFEKAKNYNPDAKYPGTFRRSLYNKDGNCAATFKGLIESIEASNNGYKWNWDEKTLKGKKLGLVFREEPYTADNGTTYTPVRPFYPCAADKAKTEPIPEPKKNYKQTNAPVQPMQEADDNEEIPF